MINIEMVKDISRNDPCWCGSGRKYKKCHLDRDKQKPLSISEVGDISRKLYDKSYASPHRN